MSAERPSFLKNFKPRLVPALRRALRDGNQLSIEDIGFTDVYYQEPLGSGGHSHSRWNKEIDISGRFTADILLKLPILSSSMPGVTNFEIATKLGDAGGLAVLPREMPLQEMKALIERLKKYDLDKGSSDKKLWFAGAVGVYPQSGPSAMERAELMVEWGVPAMFIETQQANSALVMSFCEQMRREFPQLPIVMGVFNSVDGVRRAIDAGTSAVKVGIGTGDACLTTIMSGVSKGQVNSVIEITDYMNNHLSIPVIVDGGTSTPGGAAIMMSILKGEGAIMLGSKIAAVAESPSEKVVYESDNGTVTEAVIEGMGSAKVDARRGGHPDQRILEGTVIRREVSGTFDELLKKYEGGFRTAMYGYHGAKNWTELADRAIIGLNSPSNIIARLQRG